MGSLLGKIAEMDENGELPTFNPNDMGDVLRLAASKGMRHMIMIEAMDMLRETPNLSNEKLIINAAKKFHLI